MGALSHTCHSEHREESLQVLLLVLRSFLLLCADKPAVVASGTPIPFRPRGGELYAVGAGSARPNMAQTTDCTDSHRLKSL